MADIPENVIEAHDNVLKYIASFEKTRKSVTDLSEDVKNRIGVRAKMRTHARLIASYNKQIDKYWVHIENGALYEQYREEFIELTEAVEIAELELVELIKDFDKSVEHSRS